MIALLVGSAIAWKTSRLGFIFYTQVISCEIMSKLLLAQIYLSLSLKIITEKKKGMSVCLGVALQCPLTSEYLQLLLFPVISK
jgi:hypothetical protein